MAENKRKNWLESMGGQSSWPNKPIGDNHWGGALGDKTNWPQQNTANKNWWQNGWWGNKDDGKSDSAINSAPSGYVESDAVKALREQMEAQLGLKPGDYVSQWQPQIDSIANEILNRKDFQYDVNADALYQQYKDRYVNLGQQAMMDTMGQAAALTGGYGNSAAQIAGQQTYQGYLQGLTDKIPELYQLALDRYNQQGQDMYQRYGLLNAQEQAAYSQWQDNYNRWLAERDYSTGRYDTERGFDYGSYRDKVSDAQWKEQMEAQERQWRAEYELAVRQYEDSLADAGGGGGGGGGSSSGSSSGASSGKSSGGGYGSGYNDALLLVENSTSAAGQESIIQYAYDTGQITQAGAKELLNKVGNTQYTK